MFWNLVYNTTARFSGGLEHPFMDEMLSKMTKEFDTDARWKLQQETARWLFDNVLAVSIATADVNWPLSTKIDPWTMRRLGDSRNLNSLKFVPHRQ